VVLFVNLAVIVVVVVVHVGTALLDDAVDDLVVVSNARGIAVVAVSALVRFRQ
jgi:hypothetical protein